MALTLGNPTYSSITKKWSISFRGANWCNDGNDVRDSNGGCPGVRDSNIQVGDLNGINFYVYVKSATGGGVPQLTWGAKVSPEFKSKVFEISNRIGIDPNHL